MSRAAKSYLSHLECRECGKIFDAGQLQPFCLGCRSPLFARYNLPAVRFLKKITISRRSRGPWQWAELLPVHDTAKRLTLRKGATPRLFTPSLVAQNGLPDLWVKNDALIPTGRNAGDARAVNSDEILSDQIELAMQGGILPAPEGAAMLAGLKHLVKRGWSWLEEKINFLNTSSDVKYV